MRKTITNKSVVLDLDSTLIFNEGFGPDGGPGVNKGSIYNPRYYDMYIEDFTKPGSGNYIRTFGQLRPNAEEFVAFCNRYFANVIIWSAGKYPYVHSITHHLFRSTNFPSAILTFDDLPSYGGRVIKDLSIVYEKCKYLPNRPSITNTIVIDDDETTFSFNPLNAIHIPAFKGEDNDKELNYISASLLSPQIIQAEDVRLVKLPYSSV